MTHECEHVEMSVGRDGDEALPVLRCLACGEVFDLDILDGKFIAVARTVRMDPNNYATLTIRRASPEPGKEP